MNGWGFNITSDASATPDVWHHIALASTGSAVDLYVDGILKGSSARSTISSTANPFRIGYTSNFGGAAFGGLLDEVEIWSRALSAGEIADIYNAGRAGKCKPCVAPPPNMVSWWRSENNGDDSVGSNHGTPMNGAAYAAGMVGQAFSLDGVNDYVDLGSSATTDVGDFSIEAWVFIDPATNIGEQRIVSRDDYTTEGADGREAHLLKSTSVVNCGVNGSPYVEIVTSGGGGGRACGSGTLTAGWHHLAAVRSASSLGLLVDGEISGSGVASTGTISPDAPLMLGNINPPQQIELFGGLLDEAALYSRALAAEEVAAIHGAGSAGKCAPDLIFADGFE